MSKTQAARIDPKEYARILETLELKNLYLEKGSFNVNREQLKGSLTLNIKDTFSYRSAESGIEIVAEYTLMGKNKEKKSTIRLKATFVLQYETPEEITDDFFDVFKEVSLPFIVWPFVREYVYSITSRMYLPPITLPQIHQ